jgi:hypothetical protein
VGNLIVARSRTRTLAALLAMALTAGCGTSPPGPGPRPTPSTAPPTPSTAPHETPKQRATSKPPIAAVRVAGNRFVDARGRTIRLKGFNHSGAEFSCIEGDGFFDTPDGAAPTESTVRAMRGWTGTTAVRIPLNEQCWLGLPAAPKAYAGAAYREAVHAFVDRLNRNGLVAVLDLHRSAPAAAASQEQEQMPDRDHSPTFWRSVGAAFADRPAVVFDLFNEPFPYGETNSTRAWDCWRAGGCTLASVNSGQPYVAAGMNELIAAVRSSGARNVVLAGGIHYAEGMTQWLAYRPVDPLRQLAASFHAYSFNTYCAGTACYDRDLGPLIAAVPLYVGEIGPTLTLGADGIDENCPRDAVRDGGFAASTLDWLDQHRVSYAAWSWNTWPDCWALVRDLEGDPTPGWGVQMKARLAARG